MYQQEEKVQVRRRQAERAIQLAMESRWEEAVATNKAILSLFPNDVDAYNRLGKALMEQGRHNEAKKAYRKALELDATNQIARKNLDRLNALAKAGVEQGGTARVDPTLFIEAMGRSTITTIEKPVANALAKLNAGDRVELHPEGNTLAVETAGGEFVGAVEPKLGLRLIRLMQGGNQYAAAVTSLSQDECRIIIKETHQDPSQAGRPSFPTAVVAEGMRPYTKGRLLRYATQVEEPEETELPGETEEAEPWEDETERQEGDVPLYQAAAAEDVDDEELEE